MGRQIKITESQDEQRPQNDDSEESQTVTQTTDDQKRVIMLSGTLTEQSSANIITKIVSLSQDSSAPIRMIISTYGGYVDECLAIYDAMKFSRAPITTIGLGKVMSAGVLLLAAGTKGSRYIGRSARIMMHQMHAGAYGDPFDLENELSELKRLENLHRKLIVKETKIDKKTLDSMLDTKIDRYVTPREAIRFGIVDTITP